MPCGLSQRHVPPCLSIGADETLLKIVKEIRDQIGARSRQLEAYKRDRGLHSAEFGARDMVYLLALRSLNRYAPLLSHMTAAQHGHPWTVYGLLRQLIGELSTFSGEISFTGENQEGSVLLPEYNHTRIGRCFSDARDLVTLLLDQITAGPEHILPLLFDGTYFATELPPTIFEGGNRLFLLMETESDPEQIVSAMESIAKLGVPGVFAHPDCTLFERGGVVPPERSAPGTSPPGQCLVLSDRSPQRPVGPDPEG